MIYAYDSKGKVLKKTEYDSTGAITSYTVNDYDSAGKKAKKTEYTSDNKMKQYTIYHY